MKPLSFLENSAKRNPFVTTVLLALLLVAAYYFRGSIQQAWSSRQVNRQDQQLQQQIDANDKNASAAEANANTQRDARQAAEGRAEKAQEEKQAAAVNSNRTLDPVRKARQRYEETRRTGPADSPALSDDDLCAELARRGITCR